MNARACAAVITLAAALPLAGCADNYYRQPYYGGRPVGGEYPSGGEYRTNYGVVEGIDYVPRAGGAPAGLGAVVGGVAGGVLGHQIGGGTGNTAATIAGAVGGAVVGNEVQRRNRGADEDVRVTVRMDDDSYRSVILPDEADLRPGDRVVIDGGRVYRR
jgi:outer membrane lipoprotein SlyB